MLWHYGVPSKIINIVRMLYRDRQAQVICENTKTEPFIIQTADAYSLRSYYSLYWLDHKERNKRSKRHVVDSLPPPQWPSSCGWDLPHAPTPHRHGGRDERPSNHSFNLRRNQLLRAEEESKIEATVLGSSHFSYAPFGMEGIQWVISLPTDFFPFSSISIASFSLVQRLRNFVQY